MTRARPSGIHLIDQGEGSVRLVDGKGTDRPALVALFGPLTYGIKMFSIRMDGQEAGAARLRRERGFGQGAGTAVEL